MSERRIIGFDMDGVLSDFNSVALSLLYEMFGCGPHSPESVTSWDYYKCLPDVTASMQTKLFERIANTPEFWYSLPPVSAESIEWTRALANTYDVYIITARRYSSFNDSSRYSTLGQTVRWCQKYSIPIMGAILVDDFDDSAKVPAVKGLNIQYFLDDNPRFFVTLLENGIGAYLMNRPYNNFLGNEKRVSSVKEFCERIIGRPLESPDDIVGSNGKTERLSQEEKGV